MPHHCLRHSSWLVLCLILFPSLGPAAAEEISPDAGSFRSAVTKAELDSWLRFGAGKESSDRDMALQELIVTKALATEALWLGLDRRPEVRLELEQAEAALAMAELRRHVQQSIQISDEQAEAKYQEIKDTYTQPRRVRLRNLYKRFPPAATPADKAAVLAAMEALRQRALAGEDFGELAAAESDSQSRFRKGLLGNVPAGTFPPPIDKIAMALRPGEISEILHGTDGLTVLYCEKILDKVTRTPADLRRIARILLEKRAFNKAWGELEIALRSAAEPRYRWQVLDAEPRDPSATLVELADDRLSLLDVERLLQAGSSRVEIDEVPRQDLRRRIENYLVSQMSLREIERRGLAEKDDLIARQLWARREILATRAQLYLVEARFEAPTEDEVQSYWEAHREQFSRLAFYDLSVIRLPLEGHDEQAVYRRGELLVHQIRTGETRFEDAARRHSRHTSAVQGGRLDPLSRRVLPHRFGLNFLREVLRLQPGAMSDLVAEGRSLWIVRLNGIEEPRPMTWDEARAAAENKLGTERARSLQASVLDDWMAKLQVEATPAP
ncbi:MAG: peptidylprolyl isomerase [Acidobacteriota bacterium]